jgi:outer membrane protein OmpA-like peptidoglycan-associated protein
MCPRSLRLSVAATVAALFLGACTSNAATDPVAAGDREPETTTTTTQREDPPGSTTTTTQAEVPQSEIEIRVTEIISEYDGVVTREGTQLTVPAEVLFDFDQDTLRSDAVRALDAIVEVLEFYEDAPVAIIGHTDSVGSASYNQDLSERRAAAVAAY